MTMRRGLTGVHGTAPAVFNRFGLAHNEAGPRPALPYLWRQFVKQENVGYGILAVIWEWYRFANVPGY
jgi:hypothetical protein